MRAKILLSGLFLLSMFCGYAQNSVWYFGAANAGLTSFGLDFSGGGAPVQRNLESAIDFYESVTTVSDAAGNILYYSDGIQVFDASHTLMVGAPAALLGTGAGATASSNQGAFSMARPGSDTEFYLFTSNSIDGAATGFRVNRIDMTLPGNGTPGAPLGEMVSIDSALYATGSEMMTAYGVCGSDTVWVITHAPNSNDFVRVLVTSGGIQSVQTQTIATPTQWNAGFAGSPGRGSMDINEDGTKLIFTGQWPIGTHILDFDKSTGLVSNHLEIKDAGNATFNGYGSEFSPDGTKAYFCSNLVSGMWQYDLTTGLSANVTTAAGLNHGEIITGNDGKLYVGKVSQEAKLTMGVINDPDNVAGAGAVNYDADQITFPGSVNAAVSYAMPQGFFCMVLDSCDIDSVAAVCDTAAAFQFTATTAGGTWGGGPYITTGGMFDPGTAGGGLHWITYQGGCLGIDSVQIQVDVCCPTIDPDLGNDTTICDDASLTLDAGAGWASYEWIENGVVLGSTGQTLVADSGTYIINIEDADGCPGTDTIEIGNHQLPVVDLGPDTAYCAGGDYVIDAGAFDSWLWTPGGETSQTITVSTANTYGVTVTDANGCTATDDVVVSEWVLPIPTITGNTIVCADSSTQITGNAGSGGALAWSGITPFTNPLSVTAGGTYTLIETDGNGCVDSVDHVVTLEALPALELGGPYTFCHTQGNELLDASTGAANETYLWSDASTGSTLNVTDSSIVSVIVTSENGCIAYDTAVIDTFTLPVVDLGPDTFFCENGDIVLDAGAFDSWAWTPGGETGQTITVSTANTYGVTVTDANGCTDTDDVVITENALPSVNLGPDTTTCELDSITLDATHADAASYAWTPNSETSATIKVGSTPETYGVTITDVDGCVFTTSRTISQEDLPVVDLGANDTICDDLTKTLDAGAGTNQTYAWYLDGALLGSETSQTLTADSGTYVVSVTTPLGCETRDTVLVDNHQLPIVDLAGPHEYCELDSVQLDAGNPTATYAWTPNGETTQTVWAATANTYEVTVTDTNGCITVANSVVTENDNPVVDLGANDSACVGLSIPLDATIPNGVTYVWSNGHNQATYTLVGPDTLSVIATDANGCIGYDTLEIAALDSLDLGFGGNNQVCQGSEADNPLDAGSFQGANYTWTLPDASTESGQVIIPLLDGWYKIDITDQFNCKGSDSVFNVVIPVPNISLGDDTSFCSLGQHTYTVRMEFTQNIMGTISWNESNNNANDTLFTATYAPSTVIGIFVDDATGCVHIDSVELTEFCEPTEIVLPNIFTPGGTTNSTFHPIGLTDDNYVDIVNNIVWSDFEVYNRWGLKVFQSSDLLPRWDGMYENRPVATGTYYWIYKYKDSALKEYKLNGFVQVVQQR